MFSCLRRSSRVVDGDQQTGYAPEDSERAAAAAHVKSLVEGKPWSLGDFDLGATVGVGSFGRVCVAKIRGSDDRTPLAIKIMAKSEIIRLKQVEHVMGEKQVMSMLEHPFIVNLLTTFQDEARLFMVLEYINGGELGSYLFREGRLPNDGARFYAGEIVLALSYLHSLSVVYRDLKPENLLIDSRGHVKITDFGFAKVVEDRTWTLCGTAKYLAPEIIQSKGHGKPVDWWAFGVLVFEMLAGYPPFEDESALGIYQKVLAGDIDFPRHFDARATDLIKRLLVKEVGKRLGCLKGGAEGLKRHKWFKGVSWDLLLKRALPPPFLPNVQSADDTSMFDRYPDSPKASARTIPEEDQRLFEGFSAELS